MVRDVRRYCAVEGCGAGVDSPPASRTALQRFRAIRAVAALPLVGGATFLGLFASANPLIGWAFSQIVLPDPWATIWRTLFGLCELITIWASLRPSPYTTGPSRFADRSIGTVFEPGAVTLILSLVTFNTIFAVENVLDIVFLSSGAGLPSGVTMADYAHRGAYSLIVTALLAGVFVLLALRPGSAAAASPRVRAGNRLARPEPAAGRVECIANARLCRRLRDDGAATVGARMDGARGHGPGADRLAIAGR
jgi:hypothetical protein